MPRPYVCIYPASSADQCVTFQQCFTFLWQSFCIWRCSHWHSDCGCRASACLSLYPFIAHCIMSKREMQI